MPLSAPPRRQPRLIEVTITWEYGNVVVNWTLQCGGCLGGIVPEWSELKIENSRLRCLVADLSLEKVPLEESLQEVTSNRRMAEFG
jgi:hypothetical protein